MKRFEDQQESGGQFEPSEAGMRGFSRAYRRTQVAEECQTNGQGDEDFDDGDHRLTFVVEKVFRTYDQQRDSRGKVLDLGQQIRKVGAVVVQVDGQNTLYSPGSRMDEGLNGFSTHSGGAIRVLHACRFGANSAAANGCR